MWVRITRIANHLRVDENATVTSSNGIGGPCCWGGDKFSEAKANYHLFDFFFFEQSAYISENNDGVVHTIRQGEGGEQGDRLMPFLFCVG